jgi:hypothetical protein
MRLAWFAVGIPPAVPFGPTITNALQYSTMVAVLPVQSIILGLPVPNRIQI